MTQTPTTTCRLQSLVPGDGTVRVTMAEVDLGPLGPDDVLVRVEATPINPSDLGLLLAMADPDSLRAEGTIGQPELVGDIPSHLQAAAAARVGTPLAVGNEGAGTVLAAGSSAEAQALVGRTVAMIGGSMYTQYRRVPVALCLPLPDGTDPRAGASCFVNPLTALGMVETMRLEGHRALVHTAAASNLGQMLNRICLADGVDLVNIVRRPAQKALLQTQGAEHIVDTSRDRWQDDLVAALTATGATLAFDAIGGGRQAGQILAAMETAIAARAGGDAPFSRYGSDVHKQVYLYGGLDRGPTELNRSFGMSWGIGGWLLTNFLNRVDATVAEGMRQRVVDELHTTFASRYSAEVTLAGALDPANAREYARQATGSKYLIVPSAPAQPVGD